MAMRTPPAGPQIDLNIAGARRFLPDLHDRTSEIGSTFTIQKPWMQYLQRLPIGRAQLLAQHALVLPHRLQ